jgi:hypothetical protein
MILISIILIVIAAGVQDPIGEDLFTRLVAPVLESRCVRCHNASVHKGGLALDRRDALEDGGETGPAVEPGAPAESLLLEKVSGPKPSMPKGETPLSDAEVDAIRQWITAGAHWPPGRVLLAKSADQGPWWAIEPLARPEVPDFSGESWPRTAIDSFVLARLRTSGLEPRTEADGRTLIRRVTFDLTGLPPSPEEVRAFVDDESHDAYERLVDRLLASPAYGERWARRWLDLVHYGDTHGYDKDKRRDHAWPYRDYVIGSFNEDKPYDGFVREQLAGDVLWPERPEAAIATGFIAAGPWDFVGHVELGEETVEKAKTRVLDRDDMVANTMSTFVSLTAHCARCHDHKFDPISTREYYSLQAVFAGVDRGDRPTSPGKFDGTVDHSRAEPGELVYAVKPIIPREIRILNRGEVEQPGELATPGSLACVPGLSDDFSSAVAASEGFRRAALAEWLVNDVNPLTWRSIVNRVWQSHFGRGIVDSPSDFGRNGATPSHPEMLDWLAAEFRDGGRSIKRLDRLIVTSSGYRQASTHDTKPAMIDADNRLLWRQNRRRLEAEETRDAVLAVSGRLDRRMYGPGFEVFRFKDDHSPTYDHVDPEAATRPEGERRAIYRFIVRSVPNPWIDCMDGADPNANVPVRSVTITALQALALLNDPFMIAQAEAFARRVDAGPDGMPAAIGQAVSIALGRAATGSEAASLLGYTEKHGLTSACRLILNLNEFVFID